MELWERQSTESDAAFAAWVEYRDQLPPRKLRPPLAQSQKWWKDNCWPLRCEAYDSYLDSIKLAEREALQRQTAKDIATEHMVVLKDLRAVAMRETEKFLASCNSSDMPMITKVGELAKLTDTVVKLDRLIRGEVTDRVESGPDYSKLTREERQVLLPLLAKAAKVE